MSEMQGMSNPDAPKRRLQVNPDALRLVPAEKREFWEKLAEDAELNIASQFGKRWTMLATLTVILATPDETYEEVARALNRSPGAIRYRRQAMIHLLRDEHSAVDRVEAYRRDRKVFHKYSDYAEVAEALEQLGYFDLPVREQFSLAVPLGQPSKSWRGDGSSAALAQRKSRDGSLKDEVRRLLDEARSRNTSS
ncbi:hypothetical protein ACIOHS_11200 [Streptomyces sp. NPDC088253]|uniref:hypothetical protein n=1 Tax=Streptomyces sp. NPDC088253 TaxID=3365846 RepID=UPI0037F56AF4